MFKNRILSFKHAFRGIADNIINTPNFRIHLCFSFLVILAGYFFGITKMEWIAIALCIGMVLTAESLNTSIEYLTDLVTKDYHELAKKTKDAAAGAVLISAISACIIGLYIFVPYLRIMFFG